MNSIEVRLAQYQDVPAMRQVAILSYEATFAQHNTRENMDAFYIDSYNLEKMQEEFYEPSAVLYLAFAEQTLAGFVRLRKNQEVASTLGNNTIELQRLYIHPNQQGKGIGKLLMEKAMEYASQLQVDWIWLGVWEKNYNAQKFYTKWGFEKFDEHVFQMGDDPQIDWLLKKKLGSHEK